MGLGRTLVVPHKGLRDQAGRTAVAFAHELALVALEGLGRNGELALKDALFGAFVRLNRAFLSFF